MQIEIDNQSGFCYGVINTVKLAEEALSRGKKVYCLGEIVHNEEEIARLRSRGLEFIDLDALGNISGDAEVLIRAHGEPPSTYERLQSLGNPLTDGTCPIVLHLQKKVKKAFEETTENNGQIVIYGKKDHAEVIGLAGQTNNNALVISSDSDLDKIDFARPVAIFSQTTMSYEGFDAICGQIRERMQKNFHPEKIPLKVHNSICGHVSKRGEHLVKFAAAHQVVIFVSGSHSSNGKVLYNICKQSNSKTYLVSSVAELNPEWFLRVETVGICGATSTPQWLMEEVAERIKTYQ